MKNYDNFFLPAGDLVKDWELVFLSEPFEIHTGLAVEFEDHFENRIGKVA